MKSTHKMLLMFLISAVTLTVIQAPFTLGFLGWVALVPFILACKKDSNLLPLMGLSYLVSVLYWLGNIYFVAYVAFAGYFVFCLFLGMYWPVLAMCIRFFRKVKFPLFIGVPFLIVGAEAFQGYFFTGFNWRLLGHSQWQFPQMIQIADTFGVAGITFVLAIANALIAQLIIDYKQHKLKAFAKPVNVIGIVTVCTVIVSTVAYGNYRIAETPDCITQSPLLGSVQPNIPTADKNLSDAGDAILDELIADSTDCFNAGAKLVVWPETMVLATMNTEYLQACRLGTTPLEYAQKISDLAKENGYILFGAHAADISIDEEGYWQVGNKYNSAMLYNPDGSQAKERFDKIHLVPFGEFIPLRNHKLILKLFKILSHYDYDYSLTHGTEYTTFKVPMDENEYRCGALICYEDTDPEVTRKMVVDSNGRKKTDWLVNLSNDGWYVKYDKIGEKVLPSTELSQRAVITIFRAVENRISIIRSVNTGISCVIDTTGKFRNEFAAGMLPEKALDRQGTAGWLVDSVDIDKRITFFSIHGPILGKLCQVTLVLVPILALYHAFKRKKAK